MRKTIVRPASRMDSAISLGVFCRCAPSTKAIIRSRNVSPGLDVISTTIRSERTRVPPVTAERSPPDSRMTGADSPVIADSSTEAIPSMTVPSPGITSPASTTTRSPLRRLVAGTDSSPFFVTRRATASVLPRFRAAAWALPLPSAMASAKLAKRRVNQSQSAIWRLKSTSRPRRTSRTRRAETRTAPTRTTNMTGFCAWSRGSSFRKESAIAGRTMAGSSRLRRFTSATILLLEERFRFHQEMLDDRSQREGREERQRADDDDDADQENREERAGHGKRAGGLRDLLL